MHLSLYSQQDLVVEPRFPERPRSARAAGLTVIVPTFNERGCLAATIDELRSALEQCTDEYEILVVDDGSTDGTRNELECGDNVRLLEHRTNRGYGAALKTGIRHARFSLIAITDADGTYPGEALPGMVRAAQSADMVVGARIGRRVIYPATRSLPKWFLTRFAEWMARCRIPDVNSGLRVFRKQDVDRFLNILPDGFSFTTTLTLAMLTNGYRVDFEPIDYNRRVGRSKFHPIRDTLRMLRTIIRTGMYFAPLRLFLPIAALFFTGFLGTMSYDLIVRQNLSDKTLILFVAATQLTMFGLLADMIDKRSN